MHLTDTEGVKATNHKPQGHVGVHCLKHSHTSDSINDLFIPHYDAPSPRPQILTSENLMKGCETWAPFYVLCRNCIEKLSFFNVSRLPRLCILSPRRPAGGGSSKSFCMEIIPLSTLHASNLLMASWNTDKEGYHVQFQP